MSSGKTAKALAVAIVLAFLLTQAVQAESHTNPVSPGYVITEVDFTITGATQEYVLRQKADIRVGRVFSSLGELETYLAGRKQVLVNERVLASAAVTYDLIQSAGGVSAVDVHVAVSDSWNIIALPYFRFDSNTGLLMSLRGRDYNFLGSMQTLVLNLDYTQDVQARNGFGGSANFSVPLQLGKVDVSPGLSQDLRFYPDGTPMTNGTAVSLNASYRGLGFPLSAHLSQGFYTNPEGIADDIDPYYLSSNLGTDASFELRENLAGLGPLSYNTSVSATWLWRLDGPVRLDRRGLTFNFGHSLSWGRANWVANTKRGLTASISNSYAKYLRDNSFVADIDGSLTHYLSFEGIFSAKSKFQAFWRALGGQRLDVGGALRGVIDARVDGDAGIFANLDMPIKLFDFPSHLVVGKNWLDFEVQASPFLDLALVRPFPSSNLGAENLWAAGGLEVLVYPLRMRSFIIRASLGFDLRSVAESRSLTVNTKDGTKPYEVFIGLGLFY